MPHDSKMPHGSFPSTHWSEIARVQGNQPDESQASLEALLRRYRPALRAHLVLKRRVHRNDADDLLQSFIADKILERELITQADRSKGRFRSLLLKSLENFVADAYRRERTRQKALGNQVSLNFESAQGSDALSVNDSDVFDVAWARTVVGRAMHRMQDECAARNREAIWQVFELRILKPILDGQVAISHSEIARQCNFASAMQAANALVVAKRQFRRILESVVAEYSPNADSVDAEIIDLRQIVDRSNSIEFKSLLVPDDQGNDEHEIVAEVSDAQMLRRLLDLETARPATPDELATLLDELMQMPIDDVVGLFGSSTGEDGEVARRSAAASGIKLMKEVFEHSQPPLDLLGALKSLSRDTPRANDVTLPRELAGVLYFASIALATTRLGTRISSLDDQILQDGLRLTLARPWLNESLRNVLQQALDEMESASRSTDDRKD